MRGRLPPDDLARGEPHNHVNVAGAFGDLVDIVTKTVRLGEEYLGQVVGLLLVSG